MHGKVLLLLEISLFPSNLISKVLLLLHVNILIKLKYNLYRNYVYNKLFSFIDEYILN